MTECDPALKRTRRNFGVAEVLINLPCSFLPLQEIVVCLTFPLCSRLTADVTDTARFAFSSLLCRRLSPPPVGSLSPLPGAFRFSRGLVSSSACYSRICSRSVFSGRDGIFIIYVSNRPTHGCSPLLLPEIVLHTRNTLCLSRTGYKKYISRLATSFARNYLFCSRPRSSL